MDAKKLRGKKIVLFCPNFFSYDKKIREELESLGANVVLYDDRPSNSVIVKSLIRLRINFLIQFFINRYYDFIMKNMESFRPDYVLFVNPETPNRSILERMKGKFKETSFILYMWDSVANKKGILQYKHLFDQCFTFDQKDAENLDFNFLPLFYSNQYTEITRSKEKPVYDMCFIGTIHSQRMRLVNKVIKVSNATNPFVYFYCPSIFVFFYKKYISKELSDVDLKQVSFIPMSSEHVLDIIRKSKCIVDIPHSAQRGLTMRTIEMLGAGKKIITTNEHIKNYDFFLKDNVYVLSDENNDELKGFLSKDYCDLSFDIYYKYSLRSWLLSVFSPTEESVNKFKFF
ncbi:hypothetical protein LES60_05735 [Pectobacterium brasiliense]|uniref:hypothetical protein n=1 Tax=Pectobacterium brasiliense TaxID=180957 RepID=UPI001CE12693|nr:hypothetical protein [Pectobacterium brasiliense]MCA5918297.1 hypothetical protein [Pectobacterium brasiliense]MCA5926164.1 hypothetical protein [Pectobacterium brasiliense]MCA5934161.1 hypothetical protein [Pectobacterium brasiliense]MCA5938343.1 hypothetical protein [Pectobacterium brasiliense]MCA5944606.1 hypothetical protein [Pectobacterium brasiliense]